MSLIACGDDTGVIVYRAETGGYIEGESVQEVKHGFHGTYVRARANDGYVFDFWSEDNYNSSSRNDQYLKNSGKKVIVYTAKFKKMEYRLVYQAGNGGEIEGEDSQKVEYEGNGTIVKAVAYNGFNFARWSDGVTTAERQDTCGLNGLYVTAEFEPKVYSLKYSYGEGGYVLGDIEQSYTIEQDGSEVRAVANDGCLFMRWSDGYKYAVRRDGYGNTSGNLSVKAIFGASVLYGAGNHGRIEGRAAQFVDYGDDAEPVKVVPNEGYIFVGWSDGVETAERQDLAVTKQINVWALFVRIDANEALY